jgi:hypothetical protein
LRWSVKTDFELLTHLNNASSLLQLDILSDCMVKMAEHVYRASPSEQQELLNGMSRLNGYSILCKVLGCALQQLAESVQRYLQQGQLPAALTERALSASYALCFVFGSACIWCQYIKHPEASSEQRDRQFYHNVAVTEGALCVLLQVLHTSRCSCQVDQ